MMVRQAHHEGEFRRILALFTYARRRHCRLTRTHLAAALGIRADQVRKAEEAKPCGSDAAQALAKWNGIEIGANSE